MNDRIGWMVIQFLLPDLINFYLDDITFQQNGPTPHFTNDRIDLLWLIFPGQIISGDVNWSLRTCDLILLEDFLWDYMKNINNQDDSCSKWLNYSCHSEIEPELCQNVIKYFNKRVDDYRAEKEGHMVDIIFSTL